MKKGEKMNLELQNDLQLGEAVAGCSPGVFASLLRRPLQHQLKPPLQFKGQKTAKHKFTHR